MTANLPQQTALLPCPFDNEPVDFRAELTHSFQVECECCGARSGKYHSAEAATKAWNRRAPSGELAGLRAKVEWIAVGDRLPDFCVEVLVSSVHQDWEKEIVIGFLHAEDGWTNTNGNTMLLVTHWQPLPEPLRALQPLPKR